MAEQLICNQQVVGSTPTTSSKRGKIPEWPKGADCKSVGTAFGGSNPPLPTKKKASKFRCFLFLCEREWMKNRCKATVRTVAYSNGAVVQLVYHCTTQCSVLLFIYELPNAEAIHLFRILWWILNHLSVLDASLCVQARSLSLLYESTSSHHKETIILIRKISVLWLFYCKIRVFCPFSLIF